MIDTLTSIPGWQVYVWVFAISVPAAINVRHGGRRDRSGRAEIVLMYVLGVSGAIGMSNVLLHTVFADDVAATIGWPQGNPFQTEVGFANLAIGMLGFRVLLAVRLLAPGDRGQIRLRVGCRRHACGGHHSHGEPVVEQCRSDPPLGLPAPGRRHRPLHPRESCASADGHVSCAPLVGAVAPGCGANPRMRAR